MGYYNVRVDWRVFPFSLYYTSSRDRITYTCTLEKPQLYTVLDNP